MKERLRLHLPPWLHEWLDVIVPLAQVAVILLLAWLLQWLLRRLLTRLGTRYQLPDAVVKPARNLLRWLIYFVAALMALERLGVSSDVLWTGITGFVTVGAVAFFAAWSVLSNLFCALLIFTTRPFREGDVIELIDTGDKPGIKGRVTDIRLIYTILEDHDPAHPGALLQVPNTLFFQKALRRWRGGLDTRVAAAG
ncbi:MAG: mechanosensitive ion channel [Ottowia sp.]|uniref:mechanosensitive ion channel domain-containing protein n=1 Tax=Ottowia sp. TaxID=1898956 RepID=UPI0039E34DD5